MSYNGSGTFNINTAGQPVVTGTTITSTAFNLLTADLATGLSTALTKDGQTTPTANIPMGTFKITGLGAGTAATDAAQFGQLQAGATQIATVTGTDTLTGTLSPAPTAYATGNLFSFVAANTNTGAATINLNSLGAKNITKQGTTALIAGDIASGRVHLIEYDGTRFQLLNPASSTGTGAEVFATSPTLVTPALGTPSALVGTNITGTAANFNINGTVGATTANTGAFTTLSASSTATLNTLSSSGATLTGGTINGMTVGATTAAAGKFTTVGATGTTTLSSATLVFDGDSATGQVAGGSAQIWRSGAGQLNLASRQSSEAPISFLTNSTQRAVISSTGLAVTGAISATTTGQVGTTLGVGAATPSASGAGITFPATQSASTDANTLDDYEEGTWTPTDQSGAVLSLTTPIGYYTKIGNLVTATLAVTYPITASTSSSAISIPMQSANVGASMFAGACSYTNAGTILCGFVGTNSSKVFFSDNTNQITNVSLSTKIVRMTVSYQV